MGGGEELNDDNKTTLDLLDSLDEYLLLTTESLSSTLRQGWMELASARYSMGGSRLNTVLLNHKPHSAKTTIHLHNSPHFTLRKWESDDNNNNQKEEEVEDSNGGSETTNAHNPPPIQKERAKVLSMFGTLVSPKLRASQLSFETALETLVKIANARSMILEAHDALHKDTKSTTSNKE